MSNSDTPGPNHAGPKDAIHERVHEVVKDLLGGSIVQPARRQLREALDSADNKAAPKEAKDAAINNAIGGSRRNNGNLPLLELKETSYDTVSLDGYVIRLITDTGIAITRAVPRRGQTTLDTAYTWLPRSLVQNDATLSVGDTSLIVSHWLAANERLIF